MASIRTLKSDVKYLISEIVCDCSNVIAIHPEKKDEVLDLIEEAIGLYNTSNQRINTGKDHDKAYYKAIKDDLLNQADTIYNKLRDIVNKK